MSTQADQDFEKFMAFHKAQLDQIGLPDNLRRKVWQKLQFEDFDIAGNVKIILNEDEGTCDLMCTKPMEANADVFLIDHAWTFWWQEARQTLKNKPQLLERMKKLVEETDKIDLPEEETKEEKKSIQEAYDEAIKTGGKIFDYDNMGISSLQSLPQFPETTEEVSLFGNDIMNPNDIVKVLVPLPNLRALWLNGNPVVDACSNFSMISEMMPNLEIINSELTPKAGEWAFLFYAREQGAKTLEEIKFLDLSDKRLLYLNSVDCFKRLTSLRRLNISEHPEFFMTEEKKEAIEFQALHGIDKEQKKGVEFNAWKINVKEIVNELKSVEELTCDDDLEAFVIKFRTPLGFMPNLKLINGHAVPTVEVGAQTQDFSAFYKEKEITNLINELQKVAGHYQMGQSASATWFIVDEVGKTISHSDAPNVKSMAFMYSPKNELNDSSAYALNIMWPIKSMNPNDAIYRDYLSGFSEKQFRSTRLSTWFNTPEEYFKKQLEVLRGAEPKIVAETHFQTIQEGTALKSPIVNADSPVINVYTEDKQLMNTLTDARFKFVDTPEEAQICWLLSINRNAIKEQAHLGSIEGTYFNDFANDEVLLVKDLMASLVHSTYKSFNLTQDEAIIPESYLTISQLPAFVGRFNELENIEQVSTWSIGGSTPGSLPLLTQNVDWALRLSETRQGSLLQRYNDRPFLSKNGNKVQFRTSVMLKSVLPLQAFVGTNVSVMEAPSKFTMSVASLTDESVHICSKVASEAFSSIDNSEDLFSKMVDSIRKVLKAFCIQFGDEVKDKGEEHSRAIYTVDIGFDQEGNHAEILGFSFAPMQGLNYNEAFGCLFLDEQNNVVAL